MGVDYILQKNQKNLKKIKKMLALFKTLLYNTSCRHDIGLSPNGKALDSDSSIVGVRVPQAQLISLACMRGIFFSHLRKCV